jgi:anti-anti-sigma regulatory factor
MARRGQGGVTANPKVQEPQPPRSPTSGARACDSQAIRIVGRIWLVNIEGQHDASTGPDVGQELQRLRRLRRRVIVDCSAARFESTTTLDAIWDAYTQAGNKGFAVVAPTGSPTRTLVDLSGVWKHLPVFETVTAAFASLHQSAPSNLAHPTGH